jgi:uncharacterized coiled-coil protein SlyX
MGLEQDLIELDEAIDAAQLAVARQQADLDALIARRDSLRRSLARLQQAGERPAGDREGAVEDGRLVPFPVMVAPAWQDIDLSRRQRTDAIVEVLNRSPHPMRIAEVITALELTTNEKHEYQVVASTLAFLTRSRRIENISRGLYGGTHLAKLGEV